MGRRWVKRALLGWAGLGWADFADGTDNFLDDSFITPSN